MPIRVATRILAAIALTAGAFALHPPAADACSCASPSPGEPTPQTVVTGVAGAEAPGASSSEAWSFTVESVERGGPVAGDEITVHLLTGDEAGCGTSLPGLEPGRRYRVGGTFDVPGQALHLNLCTYPILEPLGGEPAVAPIPTTVTTPELTVTSPTVTSPTESTASTAVALLAGEDDGGGLDARVVGAGVGAAGAAGAGTFGLWRLLGRRSIGG